MNAECFAGTNGSVYYQHEKTAETVICLVGKLEEVIYEEVNKL